MSDTPQPDHAALGAYTAELFAPEDAVLLELREEIRRTGMPEIHVSPEEGKLLQLLVAAVGARRVLEIGTLGGYSAIWMARALPHDGLLVTLEIDEQHAAVARDFARRAGLERIIDVRLGHALDTLAALEQAQEPPFDLCFIDADKRNYPAYLDCALRCVRPGGLILGDNAFLDGRVLDVSGEDDSAVAMREFNRRLALDPALLSIIVPIRDGLSVSLLRGDREGTRGRTDNR
jgi:caffeoyl-CoA O-methyltransferase